MKKVVEFLGKVWRELHSIKRQIRFSTLLIIFLAGLILGCLNGCALVSGFNSGVSGGKDKEASLGKAFFNLGEQSGKRLAKEGDKLGKKAVALSTE